VETISIRGAHETYAMMRAMRRRTALAFTQLIALCFVLFATGIDRRGDDRPESGFFAVTPVLCTALAQNRASSAVRAPIFGATRTLVRWNDDRSDCISTPQRLDDARSIARSTRPRRHVPRMSSGEPPPFGL